ncbi:MAG TPA: hypothetical protein VG756_28025 [Pseudonocardiaceae bacterium]|jgi:hypothetical protein|nr:hypothetical protein [Pseudonocardiaceae bacterium]
MSAPQRQARIAAAALGTFADKGYQATAMTGIAAATGEPGPRRGTEFAVAVVDHPPAG